MKKIEFKEPLPSTSIQRIFQDREGYLWLGTIDGLCRFDGHRTVIFRSDFNNPNFLLDNNITCIAEDLNNNILIGTKKGLNILNKNNYRIHTIDNDFLSSNHIYSIVVGTDGSIWIGAKNRLYRYSKNFELMTENITSFNSNVNSLYEDSFGDIWVCTWGRGLFRYDKNTKSFINYPQLGNGNNPFRIYQDNQKRYWIGTWGDGLFLFEPQNNKSKMYIPIKELNNEIVDEKVYFSIIQDNYYGYLWTITYSGLKVFDIGKDYQLKNVDISGIFEKTNNIFSEIIKDDEGRLWIGAFAEGLLNINFNHPSIRNYELNPIKKRLGFNPSITMVFEDKDGDLWFNQNRFGLGIYYPTSEKIELYNEIPGLKDVGGISQVSCLTNINKSDTIWLGSAFDQNIYIIKKNKGNIRLIQTLDLRKIDTNIGYPITFKQDSRGNLWVGTTNAILMKPYNESDFKLIKKDTGTINSITEDSRGAIWIGQESSGILYIPFSYNQSNFDKLELIDYSSSINSKNIQALVADKDGNIWIGTLEGNIFMYNNKNSKFEDYTIKCGMTGKTIFDMVIDNHDNLWIATQQNLTEYNPKNGAFLVYDTSDRILINSFHKKSAYKSLTSDKIYWGGNMGLCCIESSDRLSRGSSRKSNIIITDIKINNHSVLYDNIKDKFYPLEKLLNLDHNEKNIEIDFSSLNFLYPDNVRYAYKLEGVDDDWVFTASKRQFASYNQLKKGNYTFMVKACDENNIWGDAITKLHIIKSPAFYETWWAYTIYVLMTLCIIIFTIRFFINRVKLQNELRIAKIEKDKTEELTQTKLRYFTNVSHDFLTPLTIISCTIDDLETSIGKKVAQFDIMRVNVSRLRRLLQQILDFRKIENNSMKLKISRGDISIFISDLCYNYFTPLIEKNNINFVFNSDPTQIFAYFDADKIDKIIFNLLSNAFKYTDNEGTISISVTKAYKNNLTYALIKVSDTGIGIASEDLNNIFTRFYYNKNTDLSRTNGIGLSLTKDLVEIHRGSISVESELNKGTTFIVEIPIDKDLYEEELISEIQMDSADHQKTEADTMTENEKKSINLLFVEDNEELLDAIYKILSKNYNVIKAKNGIEGLDKVKENDIDVIISDIMMPKMDGIVFCKALKNNIETSHIPVLLLTAKNSTEDRIECYNAGADGYISKPFEMKLLEARISNFLTNKKKQQQEFKANPEINISTLNYTSLDEKFLNDVVKLIEEHLEEPDFDNNAFAQHLYMSKSTLYRKIKTITGLSPIELIRNIRMKHASQMLKDKSLSISEVAYATGFSDPKHFSNTFKAEFNMSPSEYQKKINNMFN